jgi:hypothetical protein
LVKPVTLEGFGFESFRKGGKITIVVISGNKIKKDIKRVLLEGS